MSDLGTDFMPGTELNQHLETYLNQDPIEPCEYGEPGECEHQAEWAWNTSQNCGHSSNPVKMCSMHHYGLLKSLETFGIGINDPGLCCATCEEPFVILSYHPLTT